MENQNQKKIHWFIPFVLFFAVMACNLPTGEEGSESIMQNPQENITGLLDSSSDVQLTPVELSTKTETIGTEPGMSRLNPYPSDTEIVTPFWDFKVHEIARGEIAWQIIQADDPGNQPPPPGMEYLIVKIWLRNKNPSTNIQNLGLDEIFITGDDLQVHGDIIKDRPAPEVVFTDISPGEILEGWIDVLVESTEGNFMLVFDRAEYIDGESTPREVRYVALEEGASIEVPPELKAISPNELGIEIENPAKIGEKVIGEDWEVTILEAVRGQAALDIVMQMSDKNPPPEDGMEYIAFQARIRRISMEDIRQYRPNFFAYAPGAGLQSSDFIWEPRGVNNRNPESFPWMAFYFFPGLESEGWFVLTAPADQKPQIARFDVGGDFQTRNRYLQLTP
ncbi:hypothetical protein ACFLXI_03885 [Chloroflexota bacterium]